MSVAGTCSTNWWESSRNLKFGQNPIGHNFFFARLVALVKPATMQSLHSNFGETPLMAGRPNIYPNHNMMRPGHAFLLPPSQALLNRMQLERELLVSTMMARRGAIQTLALSQHPLTASSAAPVPNLSLLPTEEALAALSRQRMQHQQSITQVATRSPSAKEVLQRKRLLENTASARPKVSAPEDPPSSPSPKASAAKTAECSSPVRSLEASDTSSSDSNSNSPRFSGQKLLPSDFKPSPFSVICGRGKECYASVGNLKLREVVLLCLPNYSKAVRKKEKSDVVKSVM